MSNAVWISICIVVVVTINMFGARMYGECEFWFASIKVITITGLIVSIHLFVVLFPLRFFEMSSNFGLHSTRFVSSSSHVLLKFQTVINRPSSCSSVYKQQYVNDEIRAGTGIITSSYLI